MFVNLYWNKDHLCVAKTNIWMVKFHVILKLEKNETKVQRINYAARMSIFAHLNKVIKIEVVTRNF